MSNREKDDDYEKVVAVLNDDYRVIECRDGIQWIIQKHYPSQWESRKYHRSRKTLLAAVIALKIDPRPQAMAILTALPDWIHATRPTAVKHASKLGDEATLDTIISASFEYGHGAVEEVA